MPIRREEEVKLGDCIDTLKGFAFKSHWYAKSGIVLVKVSDFTDDSISMENITFIPGEIAKDYDRYTIREDDIIIQTVGSWPRNPKSVVGKAIRVPRACNGAILNQNAVKIIPKSHINKNFLFYLLRSKQFKDYIINTAQGAANQASITLESIKNFKFILPDLSKQKIVGSQIRIYDLMIENNNRRIKILDSISRLILNEWFMNFKFPGYENSKMIESEIRKLPVNWDVKGITDVEQFSFISKSVEPFKGEKSYFATADIEGINIVSKGERVTFSNRPSRAQKQPIIFSVWFARMKDTYKVLGFSEANQEIAKGTILSSGFAGFSCERYAFPFLYYTINSQKFHELKDMYATGATQVSLNNDSLSKIKVISPPSSLIKEYGQNVLPLLDELFILQLKNQNLTATRDLLLPKLISGELDVSELDIKVSEVAYGFN